MRAAKVLSHDGVLMIETKEKPKKFVVPHYTPLEGPRGGWDGHGHASTMGIQSAIADWLDGPNGSTNKKLMKNLFIFGVAVAILYNWDVVIGDLSDEPPAPA